MSSQDERAGDEEYGAEPTVRFDAFRARRADERAQQQAQSEYVFPEEYAASPDAVFASQKPPIQPTSPYGGYDPDPATTAGGGTGGTGAPGTPKHRWRSVAVLGGAVLVAAVLGFGAWAAFESGGASAGGSSAGGIATNAATAGSTGADGDRATAAVTFRVTIHSMGADSFAGTVLANGENVTVKLTSKTRFGTKAHPFSRSGLLPGETVLVRGHRTGTDTVTATVVAANTTASAEVES